MLLRVLPQPTGQCPFPGVMSSSFVCLGRTAVSWGSVGNLFGLTSFLSDKNDSGNQPFNEHLLWAGSYKLLSHFLLTITRQDLCDTLILKRGNLRPREANDLHSCTAR